MKMLSLKIGVRLAAGFGIGLLLNGIAVCVGIWGLEAQRHSAEFATGRVYSALAIVHADGTDGAAGLAIGERRT